jgi:uncharacterized protein (DUF39 family)
MMGGAACVVAWGGTARFSMNASTVMIIAVAAAMTPASHITIVAFASATSAFVASVGSTVSIRVSSLASRHMAEYSLGKKRIPMRCYTSN